MHAEMKQDGMAGKEQTTQAATVCLPPRGCAAVLHFESIFPLSFASLASITSTLLILLPAPLNAHAAEVYPSRPVRIIVGFPPGGPTDLVARLSAQQLSDALGQQVVVDNRPGAGGTLGTTLLTKSSPDG